MTLYLNALGIACPLGSGKEAVACGLAAGRRDGLVQRGDFIPGRQIPVGVVGADLPAMPAAFKHYDCRNNRLMLACINEISPAIAEAIGRYGADRIAVVVGTSTSGIVEGEQAMERRLASGSWPPAYSYTQQEPGSLGEFTAEFLGLTGPSYTITTACSSGGKVFAAAERLIRAGFCDAALVGGADSLCGLTLNGFHSLEAISSGFCNPSGMGRDGINIGEGAALFLLEPRVGPVALLGVGESSDAYHISAPDPEGRGALKAMEQALAQAGLAPDAIAYVNLHGTATPLNDLAEGIAVAGLFGDRTPCSSTKGMTGHMLGAAGACEAGFLWLTLHPDYSTGLLPRHVFDGEIDPAIPHLALVTEDTPVAEAPRVAMLSNSFAFGGNNVAVILGRGW